MNYLLARPDAAEIVLKFGEIEVILGIPLAESMQVETWMWNGAHHAYVRSWEEAGWRATLDRRNHCVRFTQDEVSDE